MRNVEQYFISQQLSGSLLTSLSDPEVYLAGASGAVYALMVMIGGQVIVRLKPKLESSLIFQLYPTNHLRNPTTNSGQNSQGTEQNQR